MHTEVSILHKDYPAGMRALVDEKLHALNRFCGQLISMRALLEIDKDEHRVEIIAHVGHGNPLIADSRGKTFGATLDEALDRMSRILKRHSEKLTVGRRRTARARQ